MITRRRLLTLALASALFLGAGCIDQQQLLSGSSVAVGGSSGPDMAQIVTVGRTGTLIRLTLGLGCDSGQLLDVTIQNVVGGQPGGIPLGLWVFAPGNSAASPGLANLTFPEEPFFEAGDQFAVVIGAPQSSNCRVLVSNGNTYAGGLAMTRQAPPLWTVQAYDILFSTLVNPLSGP